MNETGLIPLIVMFICHAWVAIDMLLTKNYPMFIVFSCYALSVTGFIWALYYKV